MEVIVQKDDTWDLVDPTYLRRLERKKVMVVAVVEVVGGVLWVVAKLMPVEVACLIAIDRYCTLDTRVMADEEVVKVTGEQKIVGGPFLTDRIVYQSD